MVVNLSKEKGVSTSKVQHPFLILALFKHTKEKVTHQNKWWAMHFDDFDATLLLPRSFIIEIDSNPGVWNTVRASNHFGSKC